MAFDFHFAEGGCETDFVIGLSLSVHGAEGAL